MGYLSSLLPCGYSNKKRKKAFQTVELKVKMDCDGCEYKTCLIVAGVHSVEINRKLNKVTVTGYVEPNRVLKRVQSTGKKAEIWPYVPYNLVTNPYVTGTYDKKAPPGYVRKGEATQVPSLAIREEDQFTNLFSDDNPNACSIIIGELFLFELFIHVRLSSTFVATRQRQSSSSSPTSIATRQRSRHLHQRMSLASVIVITNVQSPASVAISFFCRSIRRELLDKLAC
ncbi:hypothetical protein M5K25_018452 [Dendrobium thyrsiflorum]|uniref:HMA domain-containing protein n=1 Tax=Dendrobium thyrsiflorum TaxID=117978 RepID=A0ABD0UI01_DENTH